jgi:hypothetical protein
MRALIETLGILPLRNGVAIDLAKLVSHYQAVSVGSEPTVSMLIAASGSIRDIGNGCQG